jgi:hypothetical protein
LKFADGAEFSATPPQSTPLLAISVPIGLQFGSNPGSILNQFQVTIRNGKTLGLIGGNLVLEGGNFAAPDGRIELGSVAGNSLVKINPTDKGYVFGYEAVENFQDIRLMQGAIVDTSGNSGGSIQVQGANVILANGSQITATTFGAGIGEI